MLRKSCRYRGYNAPAGERFRGADCGSHVARSAGWQRGDRDGLLEHPSNRERQGLLLAGRIDQHEAAAVAGPELLVGVEQVDALDGTIDGNVRVDLVEDAVRLDRLALVTQLQIGDVVLRVAGEANPLEPVRHPLQQTVEAT